MNCTGLMILIQLVGAESCSACAPSPNSSGYETAVLKPEFKSYRSERAKAYVDDFPLSKAGFLECFYIPVGAPLPLEYLFDGRIDVGEPLDRTKRVSSSRR